MKESLAGNRPSRRYVRCSTGGRLVPIKRPDWHIWPLASSPLRYGQARSSVDESARRSRRPRCLSPLTGSEVLVADRGEGRLMVMISDPQKRLMAGAGPCDHAGSHNARARG
jgi:hypothetical protein